MSESNTDTQTDDVPHGKHAGRLDLTFDHVVSGRWLDEDSIGLVVFGPDGSIDPRIVDAELHPRVTRGEMSVVAQAAADLGIFKHRAFADYGDSDDPGPYIHQYEVDGVWHDTLTYRYDPQASRYGSIDFYVDGPGEA